MNKTLNFFKRNIKEVLRDPMIYIFCLGFPIVMMVIFQVINGASEGNTPMFEMASLLPGIIMFSYTFVMLTMALLVSKDRQTFFLKRLYSSPMKPVHFILGYFLVGFIVAFAQTIICIVIGLFIALTTKVDFINFGQVLLLILSQLPILVTNVFLGILFGTLFNDKTAPGICSIFISLSGMLGGCWMPVDTMGGLEVFCMCLPFYPSVCVGRVVTNAPKTLGGEYILDKAVALGLIPLVVFMLVSVILSIVIFKKNMVSDK